MNSRDDSNIEDMKYCRRLGDYATPSMVMIQTSISHIFSNFLIWSRWVVLVMMLSDFRIFPFFLWDKASVMNRDLKWPLTKFLSRYSPSSISLKLSEVKLHISPNKKMYLCIVHGRDTRIVWEGVCIMLYLVTSCFTRYQGRDSTSEGR